MAGLAAPSLAARGSMEVVAGLGGLSTAHGRLFVVVGVFDGIHRGHLYLIRHLRREAVRHGARPAVVTFDAHPEEVLHGRAPALLCDPEERLVRLGAVGVEIVVVHHFDDQLRLTPYERFVHMISGRTELAGFLMTPDAAFGNERRGTPEALSDLGRREGFDVVVVPPLEIGGRPVRSQEIRAEVSSGDLVGARSLLGRAFAVVGAAEATSDREARIRFQLPVALPPDGSYRVGLEPAWTTTTPATGRAIPGVATLGGSGGFIVRSSRPLPPSPRLRIAFRSRVGG
jgi:riboflavin kinase/FMN adenylyltransferase